MERPYNVHYLSLQVLKKVYKTLKLDPSYEFQCQWLVDKFIDPSRQTGQPVKVENRKDHELVTTMYNQAVKMDNGLRKDGPLFAEARASAEPQTVPAPPKWAKSPDMPSFLPWPQPVARKQSGLLAASDAWNNTKNKGMQAGRGQNQQGRIPQGGRLEKHQYAVAKQAQGSYDEGFAKATLDGSSTAGGVALGDPAVFKEELTPYAQFVLSSASEGLSNDEDAEYRGFSSTRPMSMSRHLSNSTDATAGTDSSSDPMPTAQPIQHAQSNGEAPKEDMETTVVFQAIVTTNGQQTIIPFNPDNPEEDLAHVMDFIKWKNTEAGKKATLVGFETFMSIKSALMSVSSAVVPVRRQNY